MQSNAEAIYRTVSSKGKLFKFSNEENCCLIASVKINLNLIFVMFWKLYDFLCASIVLEEQTSK